MHHTDCTECAHHNYPPNPTPQMTNTGSTTTPCQEAKQFLHYLILNICQICRKTRSLTMRNKFMTFQHPHWVFEIIIMEIFKAPTLRLKALNKHTHIMYIEVENVTKTIWAWIGHMHKKDCINIMQLPNKHFKDIVKTLLNLSVLQCLWPVPVAAELRLGKHAHTLIVARTLQRDTDDFLQP